MRIMARIFVMQNGYHSYNTRIQKGGACLEDMRLLVRSSTTDIEDRSARSKILRKKTLARTRDTFIRAFNPRFLHGDPPNAWRLVRHLEDREADLEIVRPLYYWVTSRSDRLLYDFVTQEL